MKGMFRRLPIPSCVIAASLCVLTGSSALYAQDDSTQHMRKYKPPPPSATVQVTVVRAYNGKPIPDAHVIFHPIEGDKDKGALELKTSEDGKATIDVIPLGDTVTLQVIANGFQTYGQVYKIDKLNMSMEVRMNRPAPQYSLYKNSGNGSGSGGSGNNTGSGTDPGSQKSGSSPNSAPPASDSKPSGPSGQSDPPSNGNQSQPAPK